MVAECNTIRNRKAFFCERACGWCAPARAWDARPRLCPSCGGPVWAEEDLTRAEMDDHIARVRAFHGEP